MDINLAEAKAFVDLICGNDSPLFAAGVDGGRAPVTVEGWQPDKLARLNAEGRGIFLTICCDDLKGPRARKNERITAVRALFVDLDGAPLDVVGKVAAKPHATVETSPGRYSAFWLVHDCPLERFVEFQVRLAEYLGEGYGFKDVDKGVKDLARLMRVPGFLHWKHDPVLSKLLSIHPELPPYSWAAVLEGVPAARGDTRAAKQYNVEADEEDPMVRLLERQGRVLSVQPKGYVNIRCPFDDGHSTQSTDTSTVYLPRGGDGLEAVPGKFDCKHASCAERSQSEFFAAVDGLHLHGSLPEVKKAAVSSSHPFTLDDTAYEAIERVLTAGGGTLSRQLRSRDWIGFKYWTEGMGHKFDLDDATIQLLWGVWCTLPVETEGGTPLDEWDPKDAAVRELPGKLASLPHEELKNLARRLPPGRERVGLFKECREVLLDFIRGEKGGVPKLAANTEKAVAYLAESGQYPLWRNERLGRDMCGEDMLEDGHYAKILREVETLTGTVWSDKAVRTWVDEYLEGHRHDDAQQWLMTLEWDGVPRVDTFLQGCFGLDDTPYHREASRVFNLQMAKRIMKPGCVVDHVLVLVGAQGCGKSEFARRVGRQGETVDGYRFDGWYTDQVGSMVEDAKDTSSKVASAVIVELGEMSAWRRSDSDTAKAFLTRTVEFYRPPYGRCEVRRPRHCVFIGTVNDIAFLSDSTGDRRYLPVEVPGCEGAPGLDLDYLIANRDQVLAEARERVLTGESCRIKPEVLPAVAAARERHRIDDPWVGTLEGMTHGKLFVPTEDLFSAVQVQGWQRNSGAARRLAAVMQALGWEQVRLPASLGKRRGYAPKDASPEARTAWVARRQAEGGKTLLRLVTAEEEEV